MLIKMKTQIYAAPAVKGLIPFLIQQITQNTGVDIPSS